MTHYPVRLEREEDGVTVTFPDVPEAISCGDDEAEALANAREALALGIADRIRNRDDIPSPSLGSPTVALPTLLALKAGLWQAMRTTSVPIAELARRLGAQPVQVRRLLDPDHASKLDMLDAALAALDYQVTVDVFPAAQQERDLSAALPGDFEQRTHAGPPQGARLARTGTGELLSPSVEAAAGPHPKGWRHG